jgi:hypothetical protein
MTRIGQQQLWKQSGSLGECRWMAGSQPNRIRVAAQRCIGLACCLIMLYVSCLPAERTNVLIYSILMSIS